MHIDGWKEGRWGNWVCVFLAFLDIFILVATLAAIDVCTTDLCHISYPNSRNCRKVSSSRLFSPTFLLSSKVQPPLRKLVFAHFIPISKKGGAFTICLLFYFSSYSSNFFSSLNYPQHSLLNISIREPVLDSPFIAIVYSSSHSLLPSLAIRTVLRPLDIVPITLHNISSSRSVPWQQSTKYTYQLAGT